MEPDGSYEMSFTIATASRRQLSVGPERERAPDTGAIGIAVRHLFFEQMRAVGAPWSSTRGQVTLNLGVESS